jgi:NAD(P)-dependent dehydrogenase (short-subunit alcohol dehydrogenase family)
VSEAGFVVVTGVSRGLGRSLAGGFAAHGWTVAGCGQDAQRLAELAAELGPRHDVRPVDIASEAVADWAAQLLERRGPPDMLVNNAGIINRPAPLWRVPAEEFSRVVGVNLVGTFNVLRAFLPAMVDRRRGVVVNMSSGWGRTTSPEVAPYCASKFGVEGLTGALAQELPAGMAAVALNPGIIDTDMLRTAWADGAAAHPPPADWAERAVPYLLSLGPAHNGRGLTVPGAQP